jgi:plexin A
MVAGPVDEGNCPAVGSSGNILDFCETALKISGPVPLVQQASLRLPAGSLATAVTGVTLGGPGATSLVAIVGTADGDIMKVVLWGTGSGGGGQDAVLVDTFKAAENEPILPGTTLAPAPNSTDLIVLTPQRLRRVKIADCGRYRFCGDCLSRRDPFCGWCSLENECTLQADCSRGVRGGDPQEAAWLSVGSAHHQCIHLENISPGWIPAGEPANISLQISALPELPPTDHYQCLYDTDAASGSNSGRPIVALRATKVPGGLVCPAPLPEERPIIPPGADHVTMSLAVTLRHGGGSSASSGGTVKEFVSTSIMVFRCSSHTTCLDCVASRWPCSWCIYTNRLDRRRYLGEGGHIEQKR